MRRTGAPVLVAAVVIGLVAGFVVDTVLTSAGRPTFTPVVSLPILLLVLGAVVVALAVPIYRATRGRSAGAVNPFRALRIAILAKASSIVGAAVGGLALGLVLFLLTRPVAPSVGSMGTTIATAICGGLLVAAALVAEHLCTIRKDDDDEQSGGDPAASTPAEPTGDAPAPDGDGPLDSAGGLDAATFSRITEPRSAARLPLGDGTWHQLARAYVWVQIISTGAMTLVVLAVAIALQFWLHQAWSWIPAGIVLLLLVGSLAITPRQARSYGYQLRRDDLVFRRGILWQRMVAVPYGRMQLIDITHGPLDRGFGIAQLKLVTAAAATGVTIPGLTQKAAENLRDTLVDVAETRRTGL